MRLFLRKLDSRTSVLDVNGDTTVSALKLKVSFITGIPPLEQRLSYGGKQLVESKRLTDYDVEDDSTIHLSLRLPGGGAPCLGIRFTTLKNGSKRTFSTTAPKYRRVGRGFNLEGKCMNKECEAYGELVICTLGMKYSAKDTGENLTEGFLMDKVIRKAPCPLCKEFLDASSVRSCGFYLCEYAFEGYDEGKMGKTHGRKRVEYEDGYEYHNGDASSTKWADLTIAVKPL